MNTFIYLLKLNGLMMTIVIIIVIILMIPINVSLVQCCSTNPEQQEVKVHLCLQFLRTSRPTKQCCAYVINIRLQFCFASFTHMRSTNVAFAFDNLFTAIRHIYTFVTKTIVYTSTAINETSCLTCKISSGWRQTGELAELACRWRRR